MTISIAATGANAGRAILDALASAEAICSGAIGGFVAAGSINGNSIVRAQTQRGGVARLDYDGDRAAFNAGTVAGFIASGPNRPEPLADYLVASAGIGLVTGHRLPSFPGIDGKPMNLSVLEMMTNGIGVQDAVTTILERNPSADCGLIAIDTKGNGHYGNSVGMNRPDAGMTAAGRGNSSVWVLHNAVEPVTSLAPLLAELTLNSMAPDYAPAGSITLQAGCEVQPGNSTQFQIDADNRVYTIRLSEYPNSETLPGPINIGYRPPVFRDDQLAGCLLYEPFLVATSNKLISIDGLSELKVPIGVPNADIARKRNLLLPK